MERTQNAGEKLSDLVSEKEKMSDYMKVDPTIRAEFETAIKELKSI